MSKLNERNKAVALEFWEALDAKSLKNSISVKLASDMRWDGFAPFTKTSSSEEFLTKFVEGFYSIFDVDRRETHILICLLYTSPSPRDRQKSRMPSSA